jgi:hypothetical protein
LRDSLLINQFRLKETIQSEKLGDILSVLGNEYSIHSRLIRIEVSHFIESPEDIKLLMDLVEWYKI